MIFADMMIAVRIAAGNSAQDRNPDDQQSR